jgi:glycosyltransferase involved in cell wall biosynthesis
MPVLLRGASGTATPKLRVAIFSPYPTVPDYIGGKARIVQLARQLAQRDFDVTLVEPFIPGREFPLANVPGLSFHRTRYPFLIPYLFTDRPFPYQLLVSFHPGYHRFVKKYLRGFDVYQFEHASFADLIEHIPQDCVVIYNAQNVEYDYCLSECSPEWAKRLVGRRMFALEKKLVDRATKILVCSEEDRRRLAHLYSVSPDKIEIVPNGIREIAPVGCMADGARAMVPGADQFRRRVLFSGSDTEHNRRAIRFILDSLVPDTDCAVLIKGPCGRRFRRNRRPNVFLDSTPGSIAGFARCSTVAINPVTQGGGTNLKVLDYLAHGLPVVTTEFGIRGYDDLRPFVTVCRLEDFPRVVAEDRRLSPDVLPALEKYLWRSVADRVAALYADLTNGYAR